MFCNNCGNEIREGAQWCVFCGNKLVETQEAPAVNDAAAQNVQGQSNEGAVAGGFFRAVPSLDFNQAAEPQQMEALRDFEQAGNPQTFEPAENFQSYEQTESYPNYEQAESYPSYEQAGAVQTYAEPAQVAEANEDIPEAKGGKKVRKIKKGVVTFLIVGATIIGIIIGGVAYYFNSAERDVINYINDGRYDKAIKTYDNKVSDNSVKKWILEKLLLSNLSSYYSDYQDKKIDADTFVERASAIEVFGYESVNMKITEYFDAAIAKAKDQFVSESISYETAKHNIETFIGSGFATKGSGEAILEEVETLNESREAFARAETCFAQADYANAILEYSKVIEADDNYETAVQQSATAKELYKQQVLSETENVSGKEECKAAIDKINDAMTVLPEDEELAQRYDELSKQYAEIIKKEAFAAADKAVANGDYETAVNIIRESLPYCQNDKEYMNYWNKLQSDYLSYIDTTASGFLAKGDYQGMLNVLERAYSLLPENQELKDKYDTALANRPDGMNEITISESDSFERVEDLTVTTDSVGNEYDPGNLYKITGKKEEWSDDVNGYAKIYTNSNYKRLTGVIAVSDITTNDTFCDLTIYGDDKILYNATGLSRTSAPISIDVDLTGISWIQIQITITGGETIELLLSNFSFFR